MSKKIGRNFVDIEIPKEVTDLKILDCCYNSLDNLPIQLEKLSLGVNIFFPLTNLPIILKKIKVYPQNVFVDKDYINNNINLPFGCELIFNSKFSS